MKITVKSVAENDEDCCRNTHYTVVDGKEHCLSACALPGAEYVIPEIEAKARKLFGEDVEIEYDPEWFRP